LSNFAFLSVHDAQLVQLGTLAERYFREDPSTAIFKLRQFAELVSKLIAAHHALYRGERDTFEETLRRLSFERIIPKEVADVLHALRKVGNVAVHEAGGTHSQALSALKFARQLGIWFHRTYGKKPNFNAGPFLPPPEPADATAPLKEEVEVLRQRVAEGQEAAERAQREAEAHAQARAKEGEERAIWEELAKQAEEKVASLTSRLQAALSVDHAPAFGFAERQAPYVEDASTVARLEEIQAGAAQATKSTQLELIESGEAAATKIDLDEADTRALIDQQLRDSGWEADTKALRYSSGSRPAKGRTPGDC
jgi:type I restriction enzyme, R subunit